MAATYTSGDINNAHGAAADKNAKLRYMAPPRPKNGIPSTIGAAAMVIKVMANIALL